MKIAKKYIVFSIFLSLMVHMAAFFGLYQHFLSFYKNVLCKSDERICRKNPKSQIITIAFQKAKTKTIVKNKPFLEKKVFIKNKEERPSVQLESITSSFAFTPKEKEKISLIKNKAEWFFPQTLSLQNDLIKDIKKELQDEKNDVTTNIASKTYFLKKEEAFINMSFSNVDVFKDAKDFYFSFDQEKQKKILLPIFQNLRKKYLPFNKGVVLPVSKRYFFKNDTISCGKDFSYEIEYIKNEDSSYTFALILIPQSSLEKHQRIDQNFYFLFDRSNSIQNKRLNATRHAIASGISNLEKQDNFNLLCFDSKMDMLFSNWESPKEENIQKAREFLRGQYLGKFFHTTNFFLPLSRILYSQFDEEKIHNIVIVTDGEGLQKYRNQKALKEWTDINSKFALHFICMTQDRQFKTLEMFSDLNHGKVIASSTLRGIKRHLIKLIKNLQYSIAKDVCIKTYSKDHEIEILYPTNMLALYLNQPIVILARSEKKEDFTIFLQGKNRDKWLNIKKRISFSQAKKAGESLRKKVAQYEANKCYEHYLKDYNQKHLTRAEKILKPYDLMRAFP